MLGDSLPGTEGQHLNCNSEYKQNAVQFARQYDIYAWLWTSVFIIQPMRRLFNKINKVIKMIAKCPVW